MESTPRDLPDARRDRVCAAQVKFEALEDVSELAITQMISPEKEIVPMMTPVDPIDKSVEVRGAVSFSLHGYDSYRGIATRRAGLDGRGRGHDAVVGATRHALGYLRLCQTRKNGLDAEVAVDVRVKWVADVLDVGDGSAVEGEG